MLMRESARAYHARLVRDSERAAYLGVFYAILSGVSWFVALAHLPAEVAGFVGTLLGLASLFSSWHSRSLLRHARRFSEMTR